MDGDSDQAWRQTVEFLAGPGRFQPAGEGADPCHAACAIRSELMR